ncbi:MULTISPECIES: 50S ribosomal protein L11 methyltransferase [unclassified Devosia]|uniref:50S ribosomal protein L11 methyltransferase n=1 Tax=unclassified Devosia TaxID=196773 RepID=UPI00145D7576|nr:MULTISPECIES: 50S ribosomal protein L11 methyltransferase [unclassified Devosia]MBJ6986606.1 50S ribosomal protein L11 methyltransferase [Devosia sp. MC521]QMW61646.1 50S ribosomal protein L11 methyltransferase [Devosia sp. MC521]
MSVEQVSVALTKEQAYALVDAVSERDDLASTVSCHENEETGEWIFEAGCEDTPNLEAFNEIAQQVLGGAVTFTVEEIDPSINWVAKSLEGLAPVIAGGFYVYGSHSTDPVPEGLIAMQIDAAQAFGTGHHETTTGCLEAIDMILGAKNPQNMIDVGTGTGVLAIALAKKLNRKVFSTDIDPIAVTTTLENAALNDCAELIECIEATGLDHEEITSRAPYDLVVANILAGPLTELAPGVGAVTQEGGNAILSGILNTQAQGVIDAYLAADFKLVEHLKRKDWTTLILEKN